MRARPLHSFCFAALALATGALPSLAADLRTRESGQPFDALVDSLKQAVEANGLVVVTQACASCGAAKRGVEIPGNMVLGVFRNDFAVRMLEASVPAGIEAPIRFYVTEEPDGRGTLHWKAPSAVFAPYEGDGLDQLAAELDLLFEQVAADATGK